MDTFAELPQTPEPREQNMLFELIEKALKKKQQQLWRDFKKKHSQFVDWTKQHRIQLTHVKTSLSQYLLATGFSAVLLTGTILPNGNLPTAPPQSNGISAQVLPGIDQPKPSGTVPQAAPDQLPQTIRDQMEQYRQWPSQQLEETIGDEVSQLTGVPSKATLDGHRMNKLFGFFGKEQHLYRYPGDSVEEHAKTEFDKKTFLPSGIAPGLGAFGYFAPSKTQFTKRDEERERYYIAAQTFLFPGFYTDKGFKEWLRFKKIIVYNPKNGKAVVGVIGDAGPAQWTGKSFGGSPELMHHLEMVDGKGKSEAIVLFVDDPEDKIPLGPIHYAPKGTI